MSSNPCPQAARAPGYTPPPLPPLGYFVTDEPVLPLPTFVSNALPDALVDQSITWPYHLPSFNGLDCLWWSMLVRSMYGGDATWLTRVASWAGPVKRVQFTGRVQPATQSVGLVELGDYVLIVIPGTSSEAEAITYFLSHALRLLSEGQQGWQINATWAARGSQVVAAYNAWPPPTMAKPVVVIGHSSGAAYGAYTAYTLYSDPSHPVTLVTYGSPIWGTDSLANYYSTAGQLPKTIDFAQANDLVPTVPPPWSAVDLLYPLQYAFSGRPNYRRVNSLLQFSGTNAPAAVTQPTTLDAIINAVRTLITGGGIDVQHATSSYTAAADAWAANDPSIAANQLTPAYNSLKAILVDMNAAGLY